MAASIHYRYVKWMSPDNTPATRSAKGFAIVGAGLAGLACADELAAAGHYVTLFDKARGPGGRMSTRRTATELGDASFDHGAQYFTARKLGFQALVERWEALGLAARWPEAGADAWVGVPSMNAPVKNMAAAHDVRSSARVDALLRDAAGWRLQGEGFPEQLFDGVVIALPAEQAAVLLEPLDAAMAQHAAATISAPCWTAMMALAEPLPAGTTTLRDCGPIGWAARNSSKPGRTGPETWVIQANPAWSREHLEADAAWVTQALLSSLADCLRIAIPEPVCAMSHRWRYARSGAHGAGLLYHAEYDLGVCGDWLIGPRVENAWQSGSLLGKHLAQQYLEPAERASDIPVA
jgi:predicted NAD/FAD-dependent oxidoreductase